MERKMFNPNGASVEVETGTPMAYRVGMIGGMMSNIESEVARISYALFGISETQQREMNPLETPSIDGVLCEVESRASEVYKLICDINHRLCGGRSTEYLLYNEQK